MSTVERGLHSRHSREGTSRNRDTSIFYDTVNCVDRSHHVRDYSHRRHPRQNYNARAQTSYSFYQDDRRPDRHARHRASYAINSDSDASYTYSESIEQSDHEACEAPQLDRTLQKNREFKAFCTEIAQYVVEACTRSAIQSSSMYVDNASSILSTSVDDGVDDRVAGSARAHGGSRRISRHSDLRRDNRMSRSHEKLQFTNGSPSISHRGARFNSNKDSSHLSSSRHPYQQNQPVTYTSISKRGVVQLESSPLRTQHSTARSPNSKAMKDDSINSPRELQSKGSKRHRSDKQGLDGTPRRPVIEPFPIEIHSGKRGTHNNTSVKARGDHYATSHIDSQPVFLDAEGNVHSVNVSASNDGSFVSDSHTDSYTSSNDEQTLNSVPLRKLSSNMKEDNIGSTVTNIVGATETNELSCTHARQDKKASKRQPVSDAYVTSSHAPSDDDIKITAARKSGLKETVIHESPIPSVSSEQRLATVSGSSLYTELKSVNFNKQAISVRLVELSSDFRRYKSEVAKQLAELQDTVTSIVTQIKMLECTINGLQIGVHVQPSFARGSGIFWNDSLVHRDQQPTVTGPVSGSVINSVMQYPKIVTTPLIDANKGSYEPCGSSQIVSRSPEPMDVVKSENKPPMVPPLHTGTTEMAGKYDIRPRVFSTDGQSESVHDSASSQTEPNSVSIVQMGDDKVSNLTSSQLNKEKKHRHHASSKRDPGNSFNAVIPPLSITAEESDKRGIITDTSASSARRHTRSSIQDFMGDVSSTREKSPSKRASFCQNSVASYVEDGDVHIGDSNVTGHGEPLTSEIPTDDPEKTGELKSTSRRSHRTGGTELSDRGDTQEQTANTSTCHEASDVHRTSKSKSRERRQRKSKSHSNSSKDYRGQINDEASHSHSVLSERLATASISESNIVHPELEIPVDQTTAPIHPYLVSHPDIIAHASALDPSKYGLVERLFVSDLSRSPSIFNDDTEFMISETIEIVKSIYILPGLKNNKLTTWSTACRTLGGLMINTDGPFWKATYQCARYLLALYVAYGSAVLEAGLSEIYQRFYTALKTMTGIGNDEIQVDCLLVASVLDLICGVTQLRQEGDLTRFVNAIAEIAPCLSRIGLSAQVFPLPVCLLIVLEEIASEEQFQLINTWITSNQEPQDEEQKRIADFSIYFSSYLYSTMAYVTNFYVTITEHDKMSGESFTLSNPLSAGIVCNLASLYYVGTLLQENLSPPADSDEANSLKSGLKRLLSLAPEIAGIIAEAER